MTILFDVFKELFKMFVADLRLTLATLASVALVSLLLTDAIVPPLLAGGILTVFCVGVLIESVLREAIRRRPR
jgi:hypothetical protein